MNPWWTCECGALNERRESFCAFCGLARSTPAAPLSEVPAQPAAPGEARPWLRPLCEHVTEIGEMCSACKDSVDELRREFRSHVGKILTRTRRIGTDKPEEYTL